MRRYLEPEILEYLKDKLVLLYGPRQVGKTTTAQSILSQKISKKENRVYLNWDRLEHRELIRKLEWSRIPPFIVLDEVHKYPKWKPLLKGFFDTEGKKQTLLVTGSARLEILKRTGTSLFGRSKTLRLHPFSVGELVRDGRPPNLETLLHPEQWADADSKGKQEIDHLMIFGGFPEPFIKASERRAREWRLERRETILKEDLRDLTNIQKLALLDDLFLLLRDRVGSGVSVNSLSEDLQVDHKTVQRWLKALEAVYMVFPLRPHTGRLARTLRKEPKIYSWDWSEVTNEAARFENLVASHLLKFCDFLENTEGYEMELRFIRDREKREVDFLVLKENKPWILIETKLADSHFSPALSYFAQRLSIPHQFQWVLSGDEKRGVASAHRILSLLP